MLERDIEKKVCAYASKKGWYVRKFSSPNHRGVLDRLLIKNGLVFFIEFKQLGKKATPLQLREMELLAAQHVDSFVIDNVESGKQLVDRMDLKVSLV